MGEYIILGIVVVLVIGFFTMVPMGLLQPVRERKVADRVK